MQANLKIQSPNRPGVYRITCGVRFYIGSSVRLRSRLSQHLTDLRRRKHANRKMQSAFNKYGEQSFKFEPLLVCRKEDLLTYEQALIDGAKPSFNLAATAGHPTLGRPLSAEHRLKVSASLIGNTRSRGYKHSDETRAKLRAAAVGKKKRIYGPLSAEHRAKISAVHSGRRHSAEHRQKVREAKLKYWAERKCLN
jgi:group I intron endonuclease